MGSDMNVYLYDELSTCSRRAFERFWGRYGRPYYYKPRGTLLARLSKQFNKSKEEIYNQLMNERMYLAEKHGWGQRKPFKL